MSEIYTTGFRTDVGRQRSVNEDAGASFSLPGGAVAFVVCDGMGGLHAGDVASNEAVRVALETMTARFTDATVDPIPVLDEAFRRANDAVNARNLAERKARHEAGGAEPTAAEATLDPHSLMGTTCVAGILRDDVLYLGHAGDSRAYRWRRGQLNRLTDDHSFVGERVKAGDMTEEEAKKSRFRNIVTRGVGIEETVEPEFRRENLEAGDLILICTDGLTTMVEDAEIAGMLYAPSLRAATPERIAETLVDAANRRGGSDNITVLAIRVPGERAADEESTQEMTPTREYNAPPSRSSGSSLIPALIGAGIMLLTLLALFALVRPFRERIAAAGGAIPAAIVAGQPTPAAPLVTPGGNPVLRGLTYDKPVAFSDQLARGDLLSYSPIYGLYFVAGSSGGVRRLPLTEGTPTKPIATLEMVNSEANKNIPSTQVYMTSDAEGNVYLSYTKNRTVVKKSADGATLATITGFDRPEAIAADEKGNIYVVDLNQIKICRAHTPLPRPIATPNLAASPSPAPTATPKSSVKSAKPIRSNE